ncbi:CTLH, C-terminal LisH motif [Quillaja saponaria]|uniref:CTLH, C-terminal LisH motif n=1 Tax=Quillaja saponaria TaxID=32244 RepID=A0AAD7P6U9_QUISA|nr:CTLH, C-terminal LisH motif [Quillaja saponaria]
MFILLRTVNWETLDALVIDFAKAENLIEYSSSTSSSSPSSSSSYHSRLIILQIRRALETGDIDAAIDLLQVHAPLVLDDHRFLFRLHKQEAYKEFKHVILAFLYDKDDQSSPVENEWSEKRKYDIAGLLSSVLRAHLHAYDPLFSLTLRYLISTHKGYCLHQGASSPISDLTAP